MLTKLKKYGSPMIVLMLSACSEKTSSSSVVKNIFGDDARVDLKAEDFLQSPYRFLGRFSNGCTGTLVGKKLVLTALHCLIDIKQLYVQDAVKKDQNPENVPVILRQDAGYFEFQMHEGNGVEHAPIVRFWHVTNNPVENPSKDWAIAELDHVVGNGDFLPVSNLDTISRLPLSVTLVGYSADRMMTDNEGTFLPLSSQPKSAGGSQLRHGLTASQHKGCSITDTNKLKTGLYHGCHISGGGSGGPFIIQQGSTKQIVGIHVEAYTTATEGYVSEYVLEEDSLKRAPTANKGIPSNAFSQAVNLIGALDDKNVPAETLQKMAEFKSLTLTAVPKSAIRKSFPLGRFPTNWTAVQENWDVKLKYYLEINSFRLHTVTPAGLFYICNSSAGSPFHSAGILGEFVLDSINHKIIKSKTAWAQAINELTTNRATVTGWDLSNGKFFVIENMILRTNPGAIDKSLATNPQVKKTNIVFYEKSIERAAKNVESMQAKLNAAESELQKLEVKQHRVVDESIKMVNSSPYFATNPQYREIYSLWETNRKHIAELKARITHCRSELEAANLELGQFKEKRAAENR